MTEVLIIFCYTLVAYGLSNMMVFSSGPFNIFGKLREWADNKGGQISVLFNCMMCLPTYLGMLLSLLNWFFVPIALTPFNILLAGTGFWPLAMVLDGLFTSGIVWLLYRLDEFLGSLSSSNDYEDDNDNDNIEIL